MLKMESYIMAKKQTISKKYMLVVIITVTFLCCIFFAVSIFTLNKNQAIAKNDTYKYFTSIRVEEGDTLWTIAARYGNLEYQDRSVYIEEVKSLNHLGDDAIHSGQYLIVPYYATE